MVRAAHEPDEDLARELGARPRSLARRQEWDAAAAELVDYHLRYGELPAASVPGERSQRRAWERGRAAVQELRLVREGAAPADRGLDAEPPGPAAER